MANLKMTELQAQLQDMTDAIWLINLEDGTVEIIRDSMMPKLEGQVLDYQLQSDLYMQEYVYPADLQLWQDYMSFPALIQMGNSGIRKKVFDMRFCNVQFGFEWHESSLKVLVNDDEVPDRILLTSRSVDSERQADIIKKAVETEYDYVVYIEADKNSYVMYNSNRESGTPVPPIASNDYEYEVTEFHRKFLPEDERDKMTRKLSIAHVRPILEQKGEYATYCRVIEGDVPKEKMLRFSYFDREKGIWLLTRTDITEIREEKRQRQLLQDALNAANVANRAKSEFLSRMSHDIRTPMNAIIGMTAIAGAHIEDQERILDCLQKITMSSKLLLSLINEVLDMSKVESGKIVLSEEEIELPALIQSIVSMIQPSVGAKNQTFDIHIENIHHESVVGDQQRLQQVLMNLLSNAVKYTPAGGHILLEVSEKPMGQSGFGRYEFTVADDGIGMKPEFLNRIFEPFERADDDSIRTIQGTGLGMAISKSIVEMMDGAIEVESEYGKGSRFCAACCLKFRNQFDADTKMLVGLPVLVVDNDETVCRNTCQRLAELGMDGQWTSRGQDAVQKTVAAHIAGKDYFALIIDLKMPGMDGIETTRQIRAKVGREIPIIMISAYDWTEYEAEALEAGVDCFIIKPLFQSRLAYKMKQFLTNGPVQNTKRPLPFTPGSHVGKRILLVEDNDLNLEIAKELIESTGASVETALNGKAALDRMCEAQEGYYDLIFMDMQMPVIDGCTATTKIRGLDRRDVKKLPIIAMTANAFTEDIQKTRRAGMDEHLSKPIDMARLSQTLDRFLGLADGRNRD